MSDNLLHFFFFSWFLSRPGKLRSNTQKSHDSFPLNPLVSQSFHNTPSEADSTVRDAMHYSIIAHLRPNSVSPSEVLLYLFPLHFRQALKIPFQSLTNNPS